MKFFSDISKLRILIRCSVDLLPQACRFLILWIMFMAFPISRLFYLPFQFVFFYLNPWHRLQRLNSLWGSLCRFANVSSICPWFWCILFFREFWKKIDLDKKNLICSVVCSQTIGLDLVLLNPLSPDGNSSSHLIILPIVKQWKQKIVFELWRKPQCSTF